MMMTMMIRTLPKKWSETERKSISARSCFSIFAINYDIFQFSPLSIRPTSFSLVIKWFRKWEKLMILWAYNKAIQILFLAVISCYLPKAHRFRWICINFTQELVPQIPQKIVFLSTFQSPSIAAAVVVIFCALNSHHFSSSRFVNWLMRWKTHLLNVKEELHSVSTSHERLNISLINLNGFHCDFYSIYYFFLSALCSVISHLLLLRLPTFFSLSLAFNIILGLIQLLWRRKLFHAGCDSRCQFLPLKKKNDYISLQSYDWLY